MVDKNARIALKQMRMEIAGDYGMNYEDAFEIIENASTNGVLANHFKKLETKKKLGESISTLSNKKM
ncbi:spore protein [Romboutsia weinsteinii]|uniref:Spore protein n=2 Tax=Romboutsia weinsteinii TaxID=2020949 RepID=A0A371J7V5_9FIRM|nr:spore protein [Romboutsia weinsteinii]